MTDDGRAQLIDGLYAEYEKLPVLQDLAAGRPAVRGHGPLDAPVLVVGEAPGEKEEQAGRPFVGPSGRLLQELLATAGLPWGACYATNVVCWRPRANRTPYPFEVQASRARLAAETAAVDPLVVIAAGAVAWRGLTVGLGPFEAARMKWHELDGRRLLCVPHPSFLLRLNAGERSMWEAQTVRALSGAFAEAG